MSAKDKRKAEAAAKKAARDAASFLFLVCFLQLAFVLAYMSAKDTRRAEVAAKKRMQQAPVTFY